MAKESVAVVVAHPDDEILAFGGVMAKHASRGDDVHLLIMATGLAARSDNNTVDASNLDSLRKDARAAAAVLGVTKIEFADFPDNRMDSVALLDVVKRIEQFIGQVQARTVYTHHEGDMNIDHTVIARAVLTACRPLPGASVQRIYSGEVLSSSEYAEAGTVSCPTVMSISTGTSNSNAKRCNATGAKSGLLRIRGRSKRSERLPRFAAVNAG